MISHKKLKDEINRLEKSIELTNKEISKLPKGTLQCHRDRNYWHWYIEEKKQDDKGVFHRHRKYLPKDKRSTAEALAKKGLLSCKLKDDEQELRALKLYQRYRSNYDRVDKYINRSAELYSLTKKLFENTWPIEVQNWLDESTDREPYMPEKLVYRCRSGIMVRSKSEQLIGGALFYHKIPYKYEEPITINGTVMIPDFTILNPLTGEICLWEHFGLMSDPSYVSRTLNKIREYIRNGFIPFENLIMTFESKSGGVDEVWIDRIIETFFQ